MAGNGLSLRPMGRGQIIPSYPMVPQGGQVGRLPTRLTGLRRQLYEPRWSSKLVEAGRRKDLVFFKETNENNRISNVQIGGQSSIHEGIVVYRLLCLFWPGCSEADLAAFFRQAIFNIKVQRDTAYQLLAMTAGIAGVGFGGNTSQANYGDIQPRNASSIGNMAIGPGDVFEVRVQVDVALPTLNDMPVSFQLEAMADEPI